jgi:hypothetical protein
MRKFVIGFVSLCAVLAAYLLYSRISSSPSIDTGQEIDIIESAPDANAVSLDGEIGKIGDVGLGTVRKAKYVTLNQEKQVEREFGFEKLLSESRDIWDIEKPYMNIYRRNFKCYVTADKGKVQVETAVGRTTPKDATFSSNVVAHIISGPPADVKESFVYLDSIVFLSEKSQLSTAGPVRFVSEDVVMDGTGMELIYNEQTERIEYFKVNDLESLNIKGRQAAAFSVSQTPSSASTASSADKVPDEAAAETGSRAESHQPDESSVAIETQKAETSVTESNLLAEQKQGTYYKCTFNKNVLVNTTEQLIFAGDKLRINDIFWAKSPSGQSAEDNAGDANDGKAAAGTAEPGRQAADGTGKRQVTAPEPTEPNVPSEQLENIVVTCDGGFVVVPRDSVRAQEETSTNQVEDAPSAVEPPRKFDEDTDRARFFTQTIDYNATTGDGIANGPSELTFYVGSTSAADANKAPVPVKVTTRKGANFSQTPSKIVFTGDCLVTMPQSGLTVPKDVTFTAPEITVNVPEEKSGKPDMFADGPAELVFYMEDANSTDINQGPVPVTVNAQKQARFLAASNQIVFEGDSRCTMIREDPNVIIKYMLLSEQITVDLPSDTNDGSSAPAVGIKHLTATGKVVRLATTKTAKAKVALAGQVQDADSQKLLGGVELKCSRCDYDTAQQLFSATGPGVMKLNNSEAPEPNEPVGRFSMQKPCWVVLDGFDTLKYFIRENRIVADTASQEKLRMDYIAAVNGRYDEHIWAKASHVEVLLHELPSNQMELSTLKATGGVEYEDKNNQFMGSELLYDQQTAIVKVKGDESQPCYYNGVLVDGIEMNVKTDKVKAEIVGTGTVQMKR